MYLKNLLTFVALTSAVLPTLSFAKTWYDYLNEGKAKIQSTPKAVAAPACLRKYDQIYGDDTLNITLAFGYADGKPDNRVFDAYMADAIIDNLTAPCKKGLSACGFTEGPRGTDSFYKWVTGPRGKRHFVVIKFIFGSLSLDDRYNMKTAKKLQDEKCAQAVNDYNSSIAQGDEVVFYLGHSRDGGGPDFCPGKATADNHVNYPYYRSHKPGLRPLLSSLKSAADKRKPVEVLGLFSCSSRPHFYGALDQASPDTGYILTNRTMKFTEVFTDFYLSLDAILGQKCDSHYKSVLTPDTALSNFFN